MTGWLRRCPAWQFVLIFDVAICLGTVIGSGAVQWLSHRHVDPSDLLGTAVGSVLGTTIIAVGYRHRLKPYSRSS
jgi:hypothetical protein